MSGVAIVSFLKKEYRLYFIHIFLAFTKCSFVAFFCSGHHFAFGYYVSLNPT